MILDKPIHQMSVEWWDHAMRIDLRGAMLGCKHAIPHMIEAGGGSIVSTSSNQGLAGDLTQGAYACREGGGDPAHAQCRDAVRPATASARNTVSPGAVRTPAFDRACPPEIVEEIARHSLIPRIGEPEDLANTVLFLASDEAAYITGHVIPVDGGQLAHLPHYAYMMSTGITTTHRRE